MDDFCSVPRSHYRLRTSGTTTGARRERLNQLLPIVNVLPLTSRKSPIRTVYPNEVLLPAGTAGLPLDSIVLCYQIRTLDKRRLEQPLGSVSDQSLQSAIAEAVRFQLDL
jgi:mRNA interferase MazF